MEPWDLEEVETLWRDTLAVVHELTLSVEEDAERFDSESFEATVTHDDARLLQLAEEARSAAHRGRHIAYLLDVFAEGLERRELPLVRAAAHGLRRIAEIEFLLARDGVQGA